MPGGLLPDALLLCEGKLQTTVCALPVFLVEGICASISLTSLQAPFAVRPELARGSVSFPLFHFTTWADRVRCMGVRQMMAQGLTVWSL